MWQNIKKEGSKFLKTSGQKALEKAPPVVGDYIGSKSADKITSRERHAGEIIMPPEKRQPILKDLRMF